MKRQSIRFSKEHPRVRGENKVQDAEAKLQSGTSPRARGKQSYLTASEVAKRNIPACAGKTQGLGAPCRFS